MNILLKEILKPLYWYVKDKNYREFVKLYNKYAHRPRYQPVSNIKVLEFIVDIPDTLSFVWQFKDIFVDEIYKFSATSSEPIIYDCGANIGISCLYFKTLYPQAKIKAFEADPYIIEFLKKNLSRNGLKDIDIIDKAVWIDYNGVEFYMEGADGGSIKTSKASEGNKVKVGSIRLKDFIEKEEEVDFLKIDIEGAEYEVLHDCRDTLTKVNHIFVEYHSFSNEPQKLSKVCSILEENGFRYYIDSISKRKNTLYKSTFR